MERTDNFYSAFLWDSSDTIGVWDNVSSLDANWGILSRFQDVGINVALHVIGYY